MLYHSCNVGGLKLHGNEVCGNLENSHRWSQFALPSGSNGCLTAVDAGCRTVEHILLHVHIVSPVVLVENTGVSTLVFISRT